MIHKALILKVRDLDVARGFPFEKSYFFHRSARAHIGKCFRHGLLAPISPVIRVLFSKMVHGIPNETNSCTIGEVHGMERSYPELESQLATRSPALDILSNSNEYFMAIPILSVRARISIRKTVAYLYPHCTSTSRVMAMAREAGLGTPGTMASEWVYHEILQKMSVIFDHHEFSSFCVFCARAMLGLAGACRLGTHFCRTNMSFAGDGDFCENLANYHQSLMEYPHRMIEGDAHGSLQVNDDRSG